MLNTVIFNLLLLICHEALLVYFLSPSFGRSIKHASVGLFLLFLFASDDWLGLRDLPGLKLLKSLLVGLFQILSVLLLVIAPLVLAMRPLSLSVLLAAASGTVVLVVSVASLTVMSLLRTALLVGMSLAELRLAVLGRSPGLGLLLDPLLLGVVPLGLDVGLLNEHGLGPDVVQLSARAWDVNFTPAEAKCLIAFEGLLPLLDAEVDLVLVILRRLESRLFETDVHSVEIHQNGHHMLVAKERNYYHSF
jgi:hypothetical protein